MLNDDNKTALIKLIFDYVINERETVTSLLKTEAIVVSGDDECFTVTSSSVVPNDALKSNQEEADTKVILHAIHVTQNSPYNVVISSPPQGIQIL